MNRTKWFAWSLAALLAAPAVAGERKERGDRPPRGEDFRQRMLDEFDEDGDGELNDEERQKMRDQRREHGPPPGPPEGREGRPEGPPPGEPMGPPPGGGPMLDPERFFDRIDEDADGSISREEFVGFFEKMKEMRGGPGRPGGPGGRGGFGRGPGRGEFGPPPEGRGRGGRGRRGGPEGRPEGRRRPPAEEPAGDSDEPL